MDDGARDTPGRHHPGLGGPGGGELEHKLAALREQLLFEAAAIRTAADWSGCLRAAARLPGESFANILLIEAQRPGVTLLKGYGEWRAAGRQVSRGEQGIEVFSASRGRSGGVSRPAGGRKEPEPPVPGWRDATRVAYVWDISQTSGPVVVARSAPPGVPGEAPAGLWDSLCWLARREGFAVEREQGAPADGVTFWTPRRIRVLPGLDHGPAVWALAHQLGHVLMHSELPHPPGATTSGDSCTGIRKAEADAVAFTICSRYGIATAHQPVSPGFWAGTDPRARPATVIIATGERVTAAAMRIARHVEAAIPGVVSAAFIDQPARALALSRPPQEQPAAAAGTGPFAHPIGEPAVPEARIISILLDAGTFYSARLAGSWVPGYLSSRGIGSDAAREWRIGYAPAGWTALTDHLRAAGYVDEEIEAAGLARRSSRGTLIDQFRDRVMFPVHDFRGRITGFTGRARPGCGPAVPKYLNSPETSLYTKGSLLFGLHEARGALAAGAIPVIVEGPFDAIAVTIAGTGRLAGTAPCGIALTASQAALLAKACDLSHTRVIVAFDDDSAGRKAAIRAYGVLRPFSATLRSAVLSDRDPAQILQEEGPRVLSDILTADAEPLLGVVVDAEVGQWEHRLDETEGPLRAMRSAAAVLAGLLPGDAAALVRQAAGNAALAAVDDQMRHVLSPQLPRIARSIPADTASQIVRLADRLGFPADEILIEITNAVIRQAADQRSAVGPAVGSFPAAPLEKSAMGMAESQRDLTPGRRRSNVRRA